MQPQLSLMKQAGARNCRRRYVYDGPPMPIFSLLLLPFLMVFPPFNENSSVTPFMNGVLPSVDSIRGSFTTRFERFERSLPPIWYSDYPSKGFHDACERRAQRAAMF